MQRCVHYEQAFEHYLRANRLPYVAVDEAKKTLLPVARSDAGNEARALKSFDFVVSTPRGNLLIDVKGRRLFEANNPTDRAMPRTRKGTPITAPIGSGARHRPTPAAGRRRGSEGAGTMSGAGAQNWVGLEDVEAMLRWEALFGDAFRAVFVFLHASPVQPPDGAGHTAFRYQTRWYLAREISVREYRREMLPRSSSWRTVHLPRQRLIVSAVRSTPILTLRIRHCVLAAARGRPYPEP